MSSPTVGNQMPQGTPLMPNGQAQLGQQPQGKKPFYKKAWFWIIVVLLLAISGLGSNSSNSSSDNSSSSQERPASIRQSTTSDSSTAEETTTTTTNSEPISVDQEFSSGHYIAGIDFPAGVYDIVAVSGGGNVSSSNLYDGGINAIMGTEDKNTGGLDMYEQEYKNIDLPEGTTLTIDSVQVQLVPSA